jgi:hypothetical protein
MFDLRELTEGSSLAGVYTLEHSIRNDGTGTFFSAYDAQGERVLMKLTPDSGPDSEQQLAAWQRSRHLRHEHLLQLRDCGRTYAGGVNHIYAVFEYPDDVVASALGQGPLNEEEASGVVKAALSGLRYLHAQGMVHSGLDADHVVAVGESVKLAADSLHESLAPEDRAQDYRQLKELARQLRAPHPADEMLLAEIDQAIAPYSPVTSPALAPPLRHRDQEGSEPKTFPKWIFAGIAALLLLILAFNLRGRKDGVPVPAPSAPTVERVAPLPAPAAAQPVQPAWRVIAFTYGSRDAASKKASQVNRRWPDLNASVFVPKDRKGYYLVALGGRMKHEEATRLQRKARSLGLPRDTYVQNYNE